MKFWVKKGVAGFRLDVIDQIAKEPDKDITINGPRLHEYLRGISENVLTDEGLVTVGEAWGADTERAKRYSAPDGSELSMVFQFEHIGLDQEPGKDKWDMIPLELPRLKECLRRWQQELYGCGWNSLFFNNHDLPPASFSRWGNDKEYRVESAKMLATMLYGLQGTPYIYQGEELGMTNIRLPLEQYQDLEIHNMYKERTERGDSPESVMQSIWRRGPRQRPHPHAVDGRGERRFHHRHALAARERDTRSSMPRLLWPTGFHLLLLQKAHCPAQGAAGVPGWAVHAAVPRGRAAVCLHPRHRNGAPAGGLQLLRREASFDFPAEYRGAECLVSNYKEPSVQTIRPYEAWMLIKKEC